MKKGFFLAAFFLVSATAYAEQTSFSLLDGGYDFVAPVLNSSVVGANFPRTTGFIFFDLSSHQYKGVDDTGNPVPLNLQSAVTSTGPTATLLATATCIYPGSGSVYNCSVDGTWIPVNNTKSAPGSIPLTLTGFTVAPNCTVTTATGLDHVATLNGPPSSTLVNVYILDAPTDTPVDDSFSIICVGH